ncbi:MAG: haloacid dehalogenase-like hydrolase [Erysipelotrichaceae bacterium]|nr:haloacid dehalogenase-like hydrolase [Erysipelotrichaceae bacterium]
MMNVYDFDKTIYKDDSTRDFVFYTFFKYPKCFLSLPKIIFFGVLFGLKVIDKTNFKEKLFSYLKNLDNIDNILDEFVELHYYKVQNWYLLQQKDDDLIISASPFFLVKKFCDKMNVKNLIASNVDKYTGIYDGLNCYGYEKVLRYKSVYNNARIEEFYSDSYSDTPLAQIANKAYLVTNGKLSDWKF